ncbi:MAG: formate dehydrogenase subunit delta [Halioglobus sp.]|jgi:formate dehydrogenase subunit delta
MRMGEQIAANMAYTDDNAVVAARIADHLSRFWDPRMLEVIKEQAESEPESLSPVLLTAVSSLS